MAGHELIDGYLAELAGRLPEDVVDELADGLHETFDRRMTAGQDPCTAARAAIAEFGDASRVLAAFRRQAPGRRLARALLGTGPLVGACWAATLVPDHAWRRPVPGPLPVAFALVLLGVVSALLAAAAGVGGYRATRWVAATAGLGLVCLDAAALTGVTVLAPVPVWPVALAVAASAIRITVTSRLTFRLLRRSR